MHLCQAFMEQELEKNRNKNECSRSKAGLKDHYIWSVSNLDSGMIWSRTKTKLINEKATLVSELQEFSTSESRAKPEVNSEESTKTEDRKKTSGEKHGAGWNRKGTHSMFFIFQMLSTLCLWTVSTTISGQYFVIFFKQFIFGFKIIIMYVLKY